MNVHVESQHLEDITIPVIEITDGWDVSEIKTADDCDDAFAFLMSAVAEIEYQIELHVLGVRTFTDPLWPARARRALKYKKAALQIIGQVRSRLSSERIRKAQEEHDRVLLEYIRSVASPLQFREWLEGSGVMSKASEPSQ